MSSQLIKFVRDLYGTSGFIPLHAPTFAQDEICEVTDCIESTFVSSVGKKVDEFERLVAEYSQTRHAVACTNGTAALHVALQVAGVKQGDEVITQALTFVATSNAVSYLGAEAVFLDVDMDTLGLSPSALETFLEERATRQGHDCINKKTGRKIKAVVPMHSFGHACRIDEIVKICDAWGIAVVEDAAEALGSQYKTKPLGSFGHLSALSFNGNKIITTGGGGMVLCNDQDIADELRHLTTTAKVPHKWDFVHDRRAYNYRMPNLNAALGCAQIKKLSDFVADKRETAALYIDFFASRDETFVTEPAGARSNYWLSTVLAADKSQRDHILRTTNDAGVMTRPVWTLMPDLDIYRSCETDSLKNAREIAERAVNLPSSVKRSTAIG